MNKIIGSIIPENVDKKISHKCHFSDKIAYETDNSDLKKKLRLEFYADMYLISYIK